MIFAEWNKKQLKRKIFLSFMSIPDFRMIFNIKIFQKVVQWWIQVTFVHRRCWYHWNCLNCWSYWQRHNHWCWSWLKNFIEKIILKQKLMNVTIVFCSFLLVVNVAFWLLFMTSSAGVPKDNRSSFKEFAFTLFVGCSFFFCWRLLEDASFF